MNTCRNSRLRSACPSSFLPILTYLLFCLVTIVSASVLKVENGVYKRLTVQVNEDVSKCHCDQIIENLKVGNIIGNVNIVFIQEFGLCIKNSYFFKQKPLRI